MDAKRGLLTITRFLMGSALLVVAWFVMLLGAITIVGLPIGLIIFAVAMQVLLAPGARRRT